MPPLTVMVKPVSGLCNMNCTYCFYRDVAAHRSTGNYGKMNTQTLDNLVRRAFAYADGYCAFAFQGGEPTLAGVDFYREFLRLEKRYNARALPLYHVIQTNGFDVSDEMIELLARERFLCGVSLDGYQALHDTMRMDCRGGGTFDQVDGTIARLKDAGADVNILCVVTHGVAQHAEEVWAALSGYEYLQFIPCIDDIDQTMPRFRLSAEDYGEFLVRIFRCYARAWKKNRRVAVRLFDDFIVLLQGGIPDDCARYGRCAEHYVVEADGGVYPCDFYVLDKWRLGNVNRESFYKFARSPAGIAFREESAFIAQECRACRWYSLCRGGCRRYREPFSPDSPRLNQWCESYRMFFEQCYDELLELAKRTAKY
ncbi:MAG: radical SAM protein [Bacillota bacterium]